MSETPFCARFSQHKSIRFQFQNQRFKTFSILHISKEWISLFSTHIAPFLLETKVFVYNARQHCVYNCELFSILERVHLGSHCLFIDGHSNNAGAFVLSTTFHSFKHFLFFTIFASLSKSEFTFFCITYKNRSALEKYSFSFHWVEAPNVQSISFSSHSSCGHQFSCQKRKSEISFHIRNPTHFIYLDDVLLLPLYSSAWL